MDEEDMINDFFDCSLTHSHGVLGCDACDEVTAKEDALSQLSMTLRNSSALTSALGSKLMFQPSYTNLAKIGGTSQLSIPGPPAHEWRTSVVIHGQHEGQMAVADVLFVLDKESGVWIPKAIHIERVSSTKEVIATGVAPASSRFGIEYVNLKP